MNQELSKKELALAKLQARKGRIKKVRQRVALFGLSLAAVFSGLIIGSAAFNQQSGQPTLIAAQRAPQSAFVAQQQPASQPLASQPTAPSPTPDQGSWTSSTTSTPVVSSQS